MSPVCICLSSIEINLTFCTLFHVLCGLALHRTDPRPGTGQCHKFSSLFHSGCTHAVHRLWCAVSLLRVLCNTFFLIFRACASSEEITGLIISLGEKLTIFFVEGERESSWVILTWAALSIWNGWFEPVHLIENQMEQIRLQDWLYCKNKVPDFGG